MKNVFKVFVWSHCLWVTVTSGSYWYRMLIEKLLAVEHPSLQKVKTRT